MRFTDALAQVQLWCSEAGPGWTVCDEGAWFRLRYKGGKILYCPRRTSGLSSWVDISEPGDEADLLACGRSLRGYEHGPWRSKRGIRLNEVSDLPRLLAWCKREAPRRPILPSNASRRVDRKVRKVESARRSVVAPESTQLHVPVLQRYSSEPVGPDSLEARIRAIVEPGWPHGYASTVGKLRGLSPFDELPPVYFVGNLRTIQPGFVLIIGMNPNIRDQVERDLITADFDQYWESRIRYFVGDSFYQGHYRPHAAFVWGFIGNPSVPTSDQSGRILEASALAIDLCPLSSRNKPNSRLLAQWLDEKEHAVFRVASEVLSEVVRIAQPGHILVRYQGTADRLREVLPQTDPEYLNIGGIPLPFSVLSGQSVSSRDAFRLGVGARASDGVAGRRV